MTTCRDVRQQLSALVDDALDGGERRGVETHLAACAECRHEFEQLAAMIGWLALVEPARAPEGFVDRVLERTRPVPWTRRLARAVLVPWPIKVPVEVAALVLVALGVAYVFQRTPELVDATRMTSREPVVERDRAGDHDVIAAPSAVEPAPPATPPNASAPAESPAPPITMRAQRPTTMAPSPSETSAPAATRERTQEAPPPAPSVAQSAPANAAPAPRAAVESIAKSRRAAEITGRLSVPDASAAEETLFDLVARHGGSISGWRTDGSSTVVDVDVPGRAYPALVRDLGAIGRWTPDREPATVPDTVRMSITLGE